MEIKKLDKTILANKNPISLRLRSINVGVVFASFIMLISFGTGATKLQKDYSNASNSRLRPKKKEDLNTLSHISPKKMVFIDSREN